MTSPVIVITHAGTNIIDYVISYERNKFICTGIGTFNFSITDNYPNAIMEWDTIVLREAGRRKGTYFVVETSRNAITGLMDISCQDGSLRLTSYFIPDIYNINYATYARYWIEKFLTEAGVTYEFNTDSQGALLSENFALGPASAYETIQTLLQNSGWYMYFDGDNTCCIGTLTVDLTHPEKTIRAETLISFLGKKDDKMLRNRVVVWGNYDPIEQMWVFADVTQHTPWDRSENDIRTTVLSNAGVRGYGTAYALAMRLLQELARITYTKELEIAGEVNLDIGDVVKLKIKYHRGDCLVTSIGSRATSNGLITTMTVDQRCPRLFGYVEYLDYVYVGTIDGGVWRKPLDSNAWESFSTGLIYWNVPDLIIKNGIFACVATDISAGGYAFVNTDRVADWHIYFPLSLIDGEGISYASTDFEAVAVDIDDYSNNILIGYRLRSPRFDGEFRSWIVEITPDLELVSVRQIFIIDQDHQNFKLIDVDKYAAERLCTAEGPAAYAPSDPGFWGTRKVRLFTDPDPKSVVLGPPPECETYDDPLVEVVSHLGAYYEDSTNIVEGNAISGFWSSGWLTYFTYDYFIGETHYGIEHPIEWPIQYHNPFSGDPYLFARMVYRKSFEALTEETAEKDRMYHVCDMVKTGGEVYLYHHQITPLVEGNSYQIQNVDLATTENIVLFGEQTIDGAFALAGMRILVKDQTNAIENGIYYVHALAAWSRSITVALDETLQNGMFVKVDAGVENRWTAWQVESEGWNTIDVDEINFARVLELIAGSAMRCGGESEFFIELPNDGYYTPELVRYPRMREGIIYYLYDGHVNVATDPNNPFTGKGTHYFKLVKYDILNSVITHDEAYQYDYVAVWKTNIKTHSPTQLIPAGTGVGFAFFLFTWYPQWESKCELCVFSFTLGGISNAVTELWKAPNYPPGGPGCAAETVYASITENAIAWTGTTMHGENPSITSYGKFRALLTSSLLYWCCLGYGQPEAFEQAQTLVSGNIDFRNLGITSMETARGWVLENCTRQPYDNLDYVELGHNYGSIFPLYIRNGSPYYIYENWTVYDAKNITADGAIIGYLNHTGLISPHQDDFDNGIYVFDHGTKKIYKESIDGTTLATLNVENYSWPITTFTNKMLYSNGYFFFIHTSYKSQVDSHHILKLKDELLFPGKNLCYLLQENKTVGTTRGLDYEIKDYDFYDLQLENSQEFPLVAWTVGSGLIVYSGCGGVMYGFPQHLKYYSVELDNTTIAGEFNDARIFTITGDFVTEAGTLTSTNGRYIGVADRNENTFSIISSESLTEDDFVTLVTFSGTSGKLETSNSVYPYIFASTSGVCFYQRTPGSGAFVDYSPGGLFGEIQTIRIDDRV